ncbi:hypothetical protein GE21DRAFT_1258313 [Neurospora crassa]|nr:hypothetical protein GE21DRAFT_1258313 [Neurospora crassa]
MRSSGLRLMAGRRRLPRPLTANHCTASLAFALATYVPAYSLAALTVWKVPT